MADFLVFGLILSSLIHQGLSQCTNAPTFDNAENSVTINNAVATGSTVMTVTASDADGGDSVTLAMDANANYVFNTATGVLTTGISLVSQSGTDTLVFYLTDTCPQTTTKNDYTVVIQNTVPVITNLPAGVSISEDQVAELSLHLLTVTDDAGDTVTCSLTSSAAWPFLLKASDKTIYSKGDPNLDASVTATYALGVSCVDMSGASDTGTLTVNVQANQAPVITTTSQSTSVSTTSAMGTIIYTMAATDAENDQLTWASSCTPSTPCPFKIYDSGAILITESIASLTQPSFSMTITATDVRSNTDSTDFSITITDINDPVTINNLPLGSPLTVMENTNMATSIYQVGISDSNAGDSHIYSMTSTDDGLTYLSIDSSTGLISTSSSTNINYEALGTTSFTLSVTVSDGTATDTQTLDVTMANVNEAPVFNQIAYTISTPEGTAGTSLGTSPFAVTDPDTGDGKTFNLDCGTNTGFFLMDTSDGSMTFASDYDVDLASRPSSVACTVTVTDTGGLTGTTALNVLVTDVNDNTPIFSPAAYSWIVSFYASAGTTIGVITATDADTGTYGTVTYTLHQGSLGYEYFGVNSAGEIYLLLDVAPLNYSTSLTLIATASDPGGLYDNATVTIAISDTTTVGTTTTTDRYKLFFEDRRNIAWFVPCIVLLLAILSFAFWFFCLGDGAKDFCQIWKSRHRIPDDYYAPDIQEKPANPKSKSIHTVRRPPPPAENHSWKAGSSMM